MLFSNFYISSLPLILLHIACYTTLHCTTLHYRTAQLEITLHFSHYTALHYIALHKTTLHRLTHKYTKLLYTQPHHIICNNTHNNIPYHTIPHHMIPYHTTLHHTIPKLTTLHYTTQHYTTQHYTTTYRIILHHTISFHIPPHHTTLYHTIYHTNHVELLFHFYCLIITCIFNREACRICLKRKITIVRLTSNCSSHYIAKLSTKVAGSLQ